MKQKKKKKKDKEKKKENNEETDSYTTIPMYLPHAYIHTQH